MSRLFDVKVLTGLILFGAWVFLTMHPQQGDAEVKDFCLFWLGVLMKQLTGDSSNSNFAPTILTKE